MFRLRAAVALVVCLLAKSVAAECRNDWDMYAAFKLIDADTGSSFEHFNSDETRVDLREDGKAPIELIFLRGASLMKGLAAQDMQRVLAKDIYWLIIPGHLAAVAVRNALGAAPCSSTGVHDVDLDVKTHANVSVEGVRFLRVKGTATADGRGQVDFSVSFDTGRVDDTAVKRKEEVEGFSIGVDTKPWQPTGSRFTYTGTVSFDDKRAALSGGIAVGGFNAEPLAGPAFVVAPGTTLDGFRSRLKPTK